MPELRDDLGHLVRVPDRVRRVVSIVPSLTEAVAVTAPGLLVGATDWCTHPPGLDVVRVRGTKNPDLARIVALRPDLVLANFEENREPDLAALRAAGLAVWVTAPRTLPQAISSLERMLTACGCAARPAWLEAAERAWRPQHVGERRRAFVPIWRRPWMALGRDTFAGDVLARLGVDHVYADAAERYPKVTLADARARRPDLVVLPDEPYVFTPETDLRWFAGWGVPVAFVSGRHLTWYGPSLAEARKVLTRQLAAAFPAPA
ncbi:helical backbone metal receptor [Carbonactinospora thermoautotrophica]|uniref:helical backbone metal receptor n=1 Tax=Carbonactinospora thermoautotrophica TaxID=1469144 RepID=UPI000A5DBE81|nr:helical backbone metal receptor [Carbonactinospora thermoautotrophica]